MLARRTIRSSLALTGPMTALLVLGACAISDEPAFISDEPAFATSCEPECHDVDASDCSCDVGLGCQDDCTCDWDCDVAPSLLNEPPDGREGGATADPGGPGGTPGDGHEDGGEGGGEAGCPRDSITQKDTGGNKHPLQWPPLGRRGGGGTCSRIRVYAQWVTLDA